MSALRIETTTESEPRSYEASKAADSPDSPENENMF